MNNGGAAHKASKGRGERQRLATRYNPTPEDVVADMSPNIDACPENLLILLHTPAADNALVTLTTNFKKVELNRGMIHTEQTTGRARRLSPSSFTV